MERGRQAQRHVGGNSKLISIQTDCQRMTSEERLRPTARSHAHPYPRPFAPPMPMPTLGDARATRIPSSHFLSLPAPSLGRGRRGGEGEGEEGKRSGKAAGKGEGGGEGKGLRAYRTALRAASPVPWRSQSPVGGRIARTFTRQVRVRVRAWCP